MDPREVPRLTKIGIIPETLSRAFENGWTGVNRECDEYTFASSGWGILRRNLLGPCSGNGKCLTSNLTYEEFPYEAGICQCDLGWNGRGEFINLQHQDCQSNILALQIIWGLCGIFIVMCAFQGLINLFNRFQRHQQIREWSKGMGKNFTVFQNIGLIVNALCCLSGFPALLSFAILVQFDRHNRIGLDLDVTIPFSLGFIFLFVFATLYEVVVVSTLSKSMSNGLYQYKLFRALSFFFCCFTIVVGILPILIVINVDVDSRVDEAFVLFLVWLGASCMQVLWFSLLTLFTEKAVSQVAMQLKGRKNFHDYDKMKIIKSTTRFAIVSSVIYTAVYLLFIVWPFAIVRFAYIFPFLWANSAYIVLRITETGTSTFFSSKSLQVLRPLRCAKRREPSPVNWEAEWTKAYSTQNDRGSAAFRLKCLENGIDPNHVMDHYVDNSELFDPSIDFSLGNESSK